MNVMVYRVTTEQYWNEHKGEPDFITADYFSGGFIHCCTASQVAGVRERYFKGEINLVLLHLEESKLEAELKYEVSTNGEKFPHLYGPINRDAIIKIEPLTLS